MMPAYSPIDLRRHPRAVSGRSGCSPEIRTAVVRAPDPARWRGGRRRGTSSVRLCGRAIGVGPICGHFAATVKAPRTDASIACDSYPAGPVGQPTAPTPRWRALPHDQGQPTRAIGKPDPVRLGDGCMHHARLVRYPANRSVELDTATTDATGALSLQITPSCHRASTPWSPSSPPDGTTRAMKLSVTVAGTTRHRRPGGRRRDVIGLAAAALLSRRGADRFGCRRRWLA